MERLAARQIFKHLSIYTSRNRYDNVMPVRHFSFSEPCQNQNKGFLGRFIENINNEMNKNKKMKESLEQFRQEREKLESTDAIKQAREKFKQVEEAGETLNTARDSIKMGVEKAKKTKIVKETVKMASKAKDVAEDIYKQTEYLKDTSAYKAMSSTTKTVEKELNDADIISSLYTPPEVLMKRSDRAILKCRVVAANDDETTIDLHKDTKWSQNWKKFKEDNPYFNKVFEYKMKFDESDNPLVRVTRNLVDKFGDITGNLFRKTDLSAVLTDICKVDPNFDVTSFLKDLEKFIVPTILEAMNQGNTEVLSDWCYEAVFNVLSQPMKEAQKANMILKSRILDLVNFELVMGKVIEQGPVLVVSFQTQQVVYLEDKKGNIIEGDPDKIIQNSYVMAFCRDMNDLDPNTAWRLVDVAMQPTEFLF